MNPKTLKRTINFLNFILIASLVFVVGGFSYWFSMQIQANRTNNSYSNPSVTQTKKSTQSPNIGSGARDSKLVSVPASNTVKITDEADFNDANCNNNKTTPSQKFNPDLKLSQDGLYKVSKNDLELKAVYGNTLIYGQNYLDQSLINYTLCVINTTAQITESSLEIGIETQDQQYLNNPGRIMIYDNLTDYTSYYREAYDQTLGNATPWGLSENDSISTFIRLRDDKAIITNQEFQDIRYRLTYNIAHEYFHHMFSTVRPNYIPFVEEGLAVFIAGKVTNQVLGYKMSCVYRTSQAKLANQKTVDLENFTITSDSQQWYKSNNISELYSNAYYFVKDIENSGELPSFIDEYIQYPSRFDTEIKIETIRPEFKNRIEKMVESDNLECS